MSDTSKKCQCGSERAILKDGRCINCNLSTPQLEKEEKVCECDEIGENTLKQNSSPHFYACPMYKTSSQAKEEKHCEKCWKKINANFSDNFCQFPDCPCHPKIEWEMEFETLVGENFKDRGVNRESLKGWIRGLLSTAHQEDRKTYEKASKEMFKRGQQAGREEERERIAKAISALAKQIPEGYAGKNIFTIPGPVMAAVEYNNGLSDALSSLNTEK